MYTFDREGIRRLVRATRRNEREGGLGGVAQAASNHPRDNELRFLKVTSITLVDTVLYPAAIQQQWDTVTHAFIASPTTDTCYVAVPGTGTLAVDDYVIAYYAGEYAANGKAIFVVVARVDGSLAGADIVAGITSFGALHGGTSPMSQVYFGGNPRSVLSAKILTTGLIYAVPWVCPRDATMDKLAIYCNFTAGGAGNARFGIYSNKAGQTYPDAVLSDSGVKALTATGEYSYNPSLSLSASGVYWLACLVDTTNIQIRGTSDLSDWTIMGLANDGTLWSSSSSLVGLYATQAYGALPATFPTAGYTGLTANGDTIPGIAMHFS